MANKRDNGGAAFPRTGYYPPTTPDMDMDSLRERLPAMTEPEQGMTLRDYFAGKALEGFMCNTQIVDLLRKGFRPDNAAEACYATADAMIAERNK